MKIISLHDDGRLKHEWLALHSDIPADVIEVSDALYQELVGNRYTKKYDTLSETVVDFISEFDFSSEKNRKKAEINGLFFEHIKNSTEVKTQYERESIVTQEQEAKAWDANNNTLTPYLDLVIANCPGADKSTLVASILLNMTTRNTVAGAAIGKKRYYLELLDALGETGTQEDLDAIVVAY